MGVNRFLGHGGLQRTILYRIQENDALTWLFRSMLVEILNECFVNRCSVINPCDPPVVQLSADETDTTGSNITE